MSAQHPSFQLAVRSGPAVGVANGVLPAFEIEFIDPFGNTLPTPSSPVTVTLEGAAGQGAIQGTLVKSPVNGLATFDDLVITTGAPNLRLQFAAQGFSSVTVDLAISSGIPAKLVFTLEPKSSAAGSTIGPVVVEIQDADGVLVQNASDLISLRFGSPSSAQLLGTSQANASAGRVVFDDLYVDSAASGLVLVAETAMISSATSTSFDISATEISAIRFASVPTSVVVNADFSPELTVEVLDSSGALVTSAVAPISLKLAAGSARAQGLIEVVPENGLARFSNLRFLTEASNLELQADIALIQSSVVSTSFDVVFHAPNITSLNLDQSNVLRGLIPVEFEVEQSANELVDVALEYALGAAGSFKRASLAFEDLSSSTASVGVVKLAAEAAKTQRLVWDSAKDLPGLVATDLQLRVTASLRGQNGQSQSLTGLSINNALSLSSSSILASGANPTRLVSADLDGDSLEDLVVLESGTSTVSVYRQDPNSIGQYGLVSSFNAGRIPSDIVIGDLNGDRRLDIAIVKSGDNLIEIRYQDATSFSFLQSVDVATENFPTELVIADINNDSFMDIVVSNAGSNSVTVHLQAPNSSVFHQFDRYAVGSLPESLAVADLNNDQFLDIAVTNRGDDSLSLLFGIGGPNSSFQSAQSLATGQLPVDIAIADLDNDGFNDLVVANHTDENIQIFYQDLNNPGQFPTSRNTPLGFIPTRLLVANVDRDLDLEIAVLAQANSALSILSRKANGDFTADQQTIVGSAPADFDISVSRLSRKLEFIVSSQSDSRIYRVVVDELEASYRRFAGASVISSPGVNEGLALADLDGDGRVDYLVTDSSSDSIKSLRGNGLDGVVTSSSLLLERQPSKIRLGDLDNDFGPEAAIANIVSQTVSLVGFKNFQSQGAKLLDTLAIGSEIGDLGIAYVGSDALTDIVVTKPLLGKIALFQQNSGGGFSHMDIDAGTSPTALAIFDIEGDLLGDFGVANINSNTVTVLRQDAAGFQAHTLASGAEPSALLAGDLDGDQVTDLTSVNFADNSISIFDGNLAAAAGFDSGRDFPVGQGPHAAILIDINADQSVDIVTLNSNSMSVLLQDPLNRGQFDPAIEIDLPGVPVSIATADVDGNGQGDIAIALADGKILIYRLGLSSQGFSADLGEVARFASTPDRALIVDLDGDNRPDLVSTNFNNGNFSVALQSVNGDFPNVTSASVSSPADLAAGSFNGDNLVDLIITNSAANTGLALFQSSQSLGTFSSSQTIALDQQPGKVLVADLNGDGLSEIITLNQGSASLLITEQDPNNPGSFLNPSIFNLGDNPVAMDIADLDLDGDLDIVIAKSNTELAILSQVPNRSGSNYALSFMQVGVNVVDVEIFDMDSDGVEEFLIVDDQGQLGLVQRNLALAGTVTPSPLLQGVSVNDLQSFELDSDGRTDLVVATDSGLVVYRNTGSAFELHSSLASVAAVTQVFCLDMNGDQILDIVIVERDRSTISVIEQN